MNERLRKMTPTSASVLLHALLFLVLYFQFIERPAEPQPPRPLLMHIVPAPTPQGQTADPAPPAPAVPQPDIARTSPDPAEQPTTEMAVEEKGQDESRKPAPPTTPPRDATASPDKVAAPIDPKQFEKWQKESEQRQTEQAKRKRELMARVSDITNQPPAVKQPFTSEGAGRGVVRVINLENYPQEMQDRFMRRFGIRTAVRYVDGGPSQSYLNAVTTDEGPYVNRGPAGYYKVMTISPMALTRMAELETEELRKRNLDPLRTRIHEVTFGLRQDPRGEVDLIVAHFRAESVQ